MSDQQLSQDARIFAGIDQEVMVASSNIRSPNKPPPLLARRSQSYTEASYSMERNSAFQRRTEVFQEVDKYKEKWNKDLNQLLGNTNMVNGQYVSAVLDNIDNVMRDFRENGSDVELDEVEKAAAGNHGGLLGGVGTPGVSAFMRQSSWNENQACNANYKLSTMYSLRRTLDTLPLEFMRQLQSVPAEILQTLLMSVANAKVTQSRFRRFSSMVECAFCKNNGEQENFYTSHVLKDVQGRVRCPVLSAFTCPRCGATGDRAHTIKYCPMLSDEEYASQSNPVRSSRLASGKLAMQQGNVSPSANLWNRRGFN